MDHLEMAKRVSEAKKRGETPEQYKNQLAEETKTTAKNLKKGVNWLGGRISELWKGLTGQTSAQATLEANERNIANQNYWNQISMEREDTAHQREMADLQAAGLNPWLSVGGGGAQASTLSTAEAEPVDGSKMLQATSAAALLAIVKLLSRKTTRESTNTNVNFNLKR